MKKPAKLEVNLLPKDPFLTSPLGRFLQWALTVGRYLVIFTEMVVIISFATRFTLDRQVTDLNGAIHQKQIIIESYGDLEQSVRAIQKKIDNYQQVEQQTNIADAFQYLSEITPQDVLLDQLTIQPGTVTFAGHTTSSPSLNLLINNIQLSPHFSNVVVSQIDTKSEQDPGYHFQIQADVKSSPAPAVPSSTSPITLPSPAQ